MKSQFELQVNQHKEELTQEFHRVVSQKETE